MKKAFSLIELLVSLIILSLLLSAFIPLMTKKLKASDITVGSFSSSDDNIINSQNDCDKISKDLLFIPKSVTNTKNLCVMKYNVGDGRYSEDWSGVQKCVAGSSCPIANGSSATATKDNLTPTCWQGTTASTCNSNYGNYSGCNRTVCNWTGGNKLCSNLVGFRLPTQEELQSFTNETYSSTVAAENGLMFCDQSSSSSVAPICTHLGLACKNTYNGGCSPNALWSSTFSSASIVQGKHLVSQWDDYALYLGYAFSARCVTDGEDNCAIKSKNKCIICNTGYTLSNNACYTTIPNCKTQSGNTCSACDAGYILSDNICYQAIPNCKTQSGGICSACTSGYTLSNNACYTAIPNCKTQSENTCSACDSGYILQNNVCYPTISNCETQLHRTCSACSAGYVLYNNACYPAISNCRKQDGNICTVCETDYNLTSLGTCVSICTCTNGTCASGKTTCSTCNSGYVLLNKTCLACSPSNGFVKVNNLCVMQYNIGDGKYNENWSGVQKCIAESSCDNQIVGTVGTVSYLPSCWQGTTAKRTYPYICNSSYGGYSGCTRTVCNWAGANQMCNNIGWRLPTLEELQSFANTTYTNTTLAENGLMLCSSGNYDTMPFCPSVLNCMSSKDNSCRPDHVWSSSKVGTDSYYHRYFATTWTDFYDSSYASASTRCVQEL